MLKIAITGNIASGKSLFESYIREFGYKVLCLDDVTAELYTHSALLQSFLLKKIKTCNKKEVSKVAFSNLKFKKELEEFIFPLILKKMNDFFEENNDEILFVSAPVLFESGFNQYFDKIVLVSSKKQIRLQRLMKRNNLTYEAALLRDNSQQKEEEKIPLCDFIIYNNSTPEDFKKQTEKFINDLRQNH